ncbi:MAG TPA: PfkB family carbohydrate kinase [Stellaceae bacterium]|nr:PfkB family carbohydrate kinase [Stellaceae bacterium]
MTILVFGSINIDIVVPVPLLPAPGETVLGGERALLPGGKGANQALAARRAGAAVAFAGSVGADGFAALALDPLRRAGVDTSLVRECAAPTGCAAIMVSPSGENAIAVAPGANALARAADVPDSSLGGDTLLLAQMEVPVGETAALLRRLRARGGRAVLSYAPALPIDPALLRDVDFLLANRSEAARLGDTPQAIARTLREGLVVTLGPEGAVAYMRDGGQTAVAALPIEPIDTTGCGDTFAGVFAAALDARLPPTLALRRASAAAGLAALARGAQSAMPEAAAIDAALTRLPG